MAEALVVDESRGVSFRSFKLFGKSTGESTKMLVFRIGNKNKRGLETETCPQESIAEIGSASNSVKQ